MPQWVLKHIALVIAAAVNLLALGAAYSKLNDQVRVNEERITELRAQRADEIRWTVQQHEKRLDHSETAAAAFAAEMHAQNAAIIAKMEGIGTTVTRMDARQQQADSRKTPQ